MTHSLPCPNRGRNATVLMILAFFVLLQRESMAATNPASMHPSVDLANGRFSVSPGRGWADLLTPLNFFRMSVRGYGLDVAVLAGTEIVPDTVIYPQIMATCQLIGPRLPDGNYALGGNRPRNRDGVYDGPPSLVVEIFSRDEPWEESMAQSQALLAHSGVDEYVAWCPEDLLWFRLDGEGVVRSAALPGLWFNITALLEREYSHVFADIIRGIESELPA